MNRKRVLSLKSLTERYNITFKTFLKWSFWFVPGLLVYSMFILGKLPIAALVVLGGVFLGSPAAIITSFAIKEIKDKKMKHILFDTNIKIVQTTLSEKNIISGVDSDGDSTNYYYFEFHYKSNDFCYKFSERVSSFAFKKYNTGDGCYLVLFFDGKQYRVDCIYWENETVILEDLQPYMLAMSQVAKTNFEYSQKRVEEKPKLAEVLLDS